MKLKNNEFYATDLQICTMCANAAQASLPTEFTMLEYLGYEKIDIHPCSIELSDYGIYIDYIYGRMVKLGFNRNDNIHDLWRVSFWGFEMPDIKYQSWLHQYKTFEQLALSAGVKIGQEKPRN